MLKLIFSKQRPFLFLVASLTILSCSLSLGKKNISAEVPFLEKNPIVDGLLDVDLDHLPKKEFNHIWQFDNPPTDTVDVTYRMAYTASHLYMHIEVGSDSINYRRRGYVNGDGFKLLLAKPHKDSLTDEYYDLVFSASKDKEYWARKRIWEYNHDQGYNRGLSDASFFEHQSKNGKTGFEILLSWDELPPYHPWFMNQLGYNLYFAKAIGDTITNGYAVVPDEGIWDEEIPKRNYRVLPFRTPQKTTKTQLKFHLKQKNIIVGSQLGLETASISNRTDEIALSIKILLDTGVVHEKIVELPIQSKFTKAYFSLSTVKLKEGVYVIRITDDEKKVFESDFTILPNLDLKETKDQIISNPAKVTLGAQHTLLFKLEQYGKLWTNLKPYESGNLLLEMYTELNEEIEQFINGEDPYIKKDKISRRAFISKMDNTLQPYSIKLPKGYDKRKKYPLLVFLHGSGSTDKGLLNAARSPGNFIEIAPFARDKYQAYVSEESQQDIMDAIKDVSRYYSVDRSKIVIGGFSMGGYGALRTFYEHPELYKGAVVHAGHPDLANYWLGGGHPNFLEEEYLEPLEGKKVFIYHGEKDGSLPISLIKEMASKMSVMNIDVTFETSNENGHEYPDQKTNAEYFKWLNDLVK